MSTHPTPLKLYLVRHGETTFSRSDGFCGSLDPDLTENGAKMAQAFADAYHSRPWAAAYVSPMKRTIQTARPLCNACGLKMRLRDGLKEIAYGDWEGKSRDEVRTTPIYEAWMTEPAWNAPPGGETATQVGERASAVVAEIVRDVPEGNVLIVSHKATIRILLCGLLGIDLGRYRDRLDALAGSVSIVRFERYGPLLESLGDRSYLPDELQNLPGT